MTNNLLVDQALAADRVSGIHNTARRLGDARTARGPAKLTNSGPRAAIAGWISRSLFRAEPCGGSGDKRLAA